MIMKQAHELITADMHCHRGPAHLLSPAKVLMKSGSGNSLDVVPSQMDHALHAACMYSRS